MKFLALILISLSFGAAAQRPNPERARVHIKDVSDTYQNFDQIKPSIANETGQPIFLSRLWPFGYARVVRFNPDTNTWEAGEWPGGCGVVANPDVPIEIQPNTQLSVSLMWRWSMDDWDHPKYFVLQDHETKRPLAGKYKLVLRYALTPWTVLRHPKETFEIESNAFTVGS